MQLFSTLLPLFFSMALPQKAFSYCRCYGTSYRGEWDINLDHNGSLKSNKLQQPNDYSLVGPVSLVWKTTGDFSDDEYWIRLREFESKDLLYNSGEHHKDTSDESTLVRSDTGSYEVEFKCSLRFPWNHCDGTFLWKLVDCGCPKDRPVLVEECYYGSYEGARDARCAPPNCPPGQYADDNGNCIGCPPGTAKDHAGSEEWRCETCRPGFYSTGSGNAECETCQPGSFQDRPGMTTCNTCSAGTFSDDGANSCKDCPSKKITETALVDYTGAAGVEGCGIFSSVGYWALAAQGSVGAGGTSVEWQLPRAQSTSDSVEQTEEFASEFKTVSGQTTYLETSETAGWSAGATRNDFVPFSVQEQVENTEARGQEKIFEVSEAATSIISSAVSHVITNEEEIACSQSCAYDPENPDRVNGFIYNWVEALADDETGNLVHFVETCRTVCKYDQIPPQCPPGFCANTDCDRCNSGAYKNPETDGLASDPGETISPTNAPVTVAPTTGAPTLIPTNLPSASPTGSPVIDQTALPTSAPTPAATDSSVGGLGTGAIAGISIVLVLFLFAAGVAIAARKRVQGSLPFSR